MQELRVIPGHFRDYVKSLIFQVLHVIPRKFWQFYAYFLTTLNNVIKSIIINVITSYALFSLFCLCNMV